MLEHVIAAS